ncbi:MAG: T9SS type A sorting domain-containing protein [Flavobacteriales bacterium]
MNKYLLIASICCFLATNVIAQSDSGCTDPQASNFNPQALFDNGSCCYENWVTVSSTAVLDQTVFCEVYSQEIGMSVFPDVDGNLGFCLPDGCYTLYIYFTSVLEADIELVSDGNIVGEGSTGDWGTGGIQLAFQLGNVTVGCTDPGACNFDPSATCNDGSCDYSCYGCTDAQAPNFNPLASIDDGSCCQTTNYLAITISNLEQGEVIYLTEGGGYFYDILENEEFHCYSDGCYQFELFLGDSTDVYQYEVVNYDGDVLATGELVFPSFTGYFSLNSLMGCNDPGACNFNPGATCSDGSCVYDCYGCTNPDAINFDAAAILDDGSCCTNTYTFTADGPFQWSVWSANGTFEAFGGYPNNNSFCLDDGCYEIQFYLIDMNGDSINVPVNWTLTDSDGITVESGIIVDYTPNASISNNAVSGCSNPWACNYNPEANCADDATCIYECYGCTDPEAGNYDPEAQFDDGSCCTGGWYTVECSTPGYWNVYSNSGLFGTYGYYPENSGFCQGAEGCITVAFYPEDPGAVDYSIQVYDENGILIGEFFNMPDYGYAYGQILEGAISGCMDPYSCNFNPEANCPDNSLCNYDCFGCTDSNAPNYNPDATIDNGTCCYNSWYTITFDQPAYWSVYSVIDGNFQAGSYPEQSGFCVSAECFQLYAWGNDGTDVAYSIYNGNNELVSEGTINIYNYEISVALGEYQAGCADVYACNYDPNANCADYLTCDYSCQGCTDPQAPNYNPLATIDNGTCCTGNWYTVSSTGSGYWYAFNQQYQYAYGFTGESTGFCMNSSCFAFNFYGFESEEISFTISDEQGNVIFEGVGVPGQYNLFSVSGDVNETAGCTEMSSCNYNPDATCDDGSCNYYCGGCTDPEAFNYNANVLYDDGSCLYQLQAPDMGMTMIPDFENNQYFVSVMMMSEGNGAPYVLSSDYNTDMLMLNEEGQYIAGPYPCDAQIDFVLQSLPANMATYMEASLEGECAVSNGIEVLEMQPTFSVYPNPSNGLFTIAGIKTNDANAQIEIFDLQGRSLYRSQSNVANGVINLERLSLADGVYQVVATTTEAVSSARVIIRN